MPLARLPTQTGDPRDAFDDAPAWNNYVNCLAALDVATTVVEQWQALQTLTDTLDAYAERDGWHPDTVEHYTDLARLRAGVARRLREGARRAHGTGRSRCSTRTSRASRG